MTSIEQIIRRLKHEGQKFGIVLNSPAPTSELKGIKEKLGVELPSDISNFYKVCNGFESEDHLFRIIPIREIIEEKSELENRTFDFAEYLIYSDTWSIRLGEDGTFYEIINCNHGTENPVVLSNSLA